MTIHQSQGSEFPEVAVFLPTDPASGLATRELLYTGVTRTKRSVDIFGTERVLNASVENRTVRVSGLADRLAERAKASPRVRIGAGRGLLHPHCEMAGQYKTKVTDGFKMGWNGVIVSLRK